MIGTNLIVLLGNIVREPELRRTADGMAMANLSLAVNRGWKDKQGHKQQDCTFFRCVLMGQQAEFASQYASRGRQAFVEGRMQFRKYTSKDGVEREIAEVVVKNFQMLGKKEESENVPQEYRAPERSQPDRVREAYAGANHYPESDVPF